MSFVRPTQPEIRARVEAEIAQRLGLGELLPRSVLQTLAAVLAGAAHEMHGHLAYLARQITPGTADAEHLDRWSSVWGIVRKPATPAKGPVTFTGTNGATIPAGTKVVRADGQEYSTDAVAVIASGTATAAVTASTAGLAGNSPAGTVLQLSSALAGVNAQATVAAATLAAGADQEDDDDLRERLFVRIQTPPQGGAAADYEAWALQVAGVTRAWVLPHHMGLGTVGVAFAVDDDPAGPIPDVPKVAEVQAHLDELRPVTVKGLLVFAPALQSINFTIAVKPYSGAVTGAIQTALAELIRNEAGPGKTLLISRLREAISTAAGEADHVLSVPSANVVIAAGAIGALGTITWSALP